MGLLDFLGTPEGQGLLAAGFGAMTSRNPVAGIGRGGLLGLQTYAGAKDQQMQADRVRSLDERQNKLFGMQEADFQARQDAARRSLEQQQSQQNYLGSIGQVTSPRLDAQPNKFDPMKFRSLGGSLDEAAKIEELYNPKPMSVKEGESLINPKTFTPIFTAPKQAAPTELARLTQEMNALPPGSPLRSAYQSMIDKTTTHAPGNNVSINMGQKGLENEFKLRDGFKGEPVYKAHQEMQSAYSQIRQSLGQATPAGDLAGATKIMKLLDPGSVVRESELGMAMAATGLLDRAQNYANMVVTGQKLTPTQRKEFQQLADALYGESVSQFNAKRSEYERLGGEYGLNAGRALGPNAAGVAPKSQAPKPANGKPSVSNW